MASLSDCTPQASLVLKADTDTDMGIMAMLAIPTGVTVMDTLATSGKVTVMRVATDTSFTDITGSTAMSCTAATMPHRM